MFDFVTDYFSAEAEKKRREVKEQALKQALKEKVTLYETARTDAANDGDDDFTEITLGQRKLRVGAKHITLQDVSDN